ncbi:MAG: hypothetical protein AAFS13_03730, partial [Pseudomonadota bacterium]
MMNALGQEGDGVAVAEICAEIASDQDIRAAILTGAGRAFSADFGDCNSVALLPEGVHHIWSIERQDGNRSLFFI